MRIARLRALTHPASFYMKNNRWVEMRIARLRALTHLISPTTQNRAFRVEMRIARLRALTHKSPVHQTGLLCAFRTEYYSERLTRIRKLSRKIGENLKLLYGCRCRLCGQLIGELFGAPVTEAHHIDYYVKILIFYHLYNEIWIIFRTHI